MLKGKVHNSRKAILFALLWVGLLTLVSGEEAGFVKAQGSAILHMGFVNVDQVIARMEGSNEVLDQLRKQITESAAQLLDLNAQLANGELSQAEFSVRQVQLNNVLIILNQQLSNEISIQIEQAASELGRALRIDLITPLRNIVVHGQSVILQDLTEPVLQALNANLGQGDFDPDSVVATTRPLSQVGFFSVDETFVKYKKTAEAVVTISEKKQHNDEEITTLNEQLSTGVISLAQFDARVVKLNAELEALNQALTSDILGDISAAVSRLGDELDFNLITGRKNVILYNNPTAAVDLTDSVVALLNADFEGTAFDFLRVALPSEAPRKVGFVDADDVFIRFEGTSDAIKQFQAQIVSTREQLEVLQVQLEAGQIDESTFLTRRQELETQLVLLEQLLTKEVTDNILDTTRKLGQELGFDLITPRKNVVLYHNTNLIEDLTDAVLERMNQEAAEK